MFADVLIEYNAKAIDQTFTYIIPESLKNTIKVGMKVLVPFANRTINGFITNIKDKYEEDFELKEITSIVDEYFCLNKELLEMGEFLQSRTLCTKIAAYQTMLPSSLKVKDQKSNYSKYLTYIELNQNPKTINEYIENNKRSPKQNDLLKTLLEEKKVLKSSVETKSSIKTLLDKGLIKETKEQIYRLHNEKQCDLNVEFTDDQNNALNSIILN